MNNLAAFHFGLHILEREGGKKIFWCRTRPWEYWNLQNVRTRLIKNEILPHPTHIYIITRDRHRTQFLNTRRPLPPALINRGYTSTTFQSRKSYVRWRSGQCVLQEQNWNYARKSEVQCFKQRRSAMVRVKIYYRASGPERRISS